jgi:SAM-dependent methyltransferase
MWFRVLVVFLDLTTEALAFNLATPTSRCDSALQAMVISASVPTRFSREDGLSFVDTFLLPSEEYGGRISAAKDAHGFDTTKLIVADDPRLCFSYGEFPTHSTDELVDLALTYMPELKGQINMLDLGSGSGRLAFYFALTRGTQNHPWSVHGLEICHVLTDIASRAVSIGFNKNSFAEHDESNSGQNTLALHLGPAEQLTDVIGRAHLIFSYCSTFKTDGFSQEVGAMILDQQWSKFLASSCRKGCVIVTTDRALDPRHGWKMLDRRDVDNREVMGSTGYIQVLQ